jgi:hypothetical protein
MTMSLTNYFRRHDHEMAEWVQFGLSLLYRQGADEACRYMTDVGISSQIIQRVISARHIRGAGIPFRIDCYAEAGMEKRTPVQHSPQANPGLLI